MPLKLLDLETRFDRCWYTCCPSGVVRNIEQIFRQSFASISRKSSTSDDWACLAAEMDVVGFMGGPLIVVDDDSSSLDVVDEVGDEASLFLMRSCENEIVGGSGSVCNIIVTILHELFSWLD